MSQTRLLDQKTKIPTLPPLLKEAFMLSREHALDLLAAQNPEQHLIQHALASEAIMRALATRFAEPADVWGLAGLLHDLDFPHTKTQERQHGLHSVKLLEQANAGLPPAAMNAIAAHASEWNGTSVDSRMARALRCAESVTGLLITAALVRPTRFEGMAAQSLKKKMKDRAFAASVSRERIRECEQLGLDLGDFLDLGVAALTPIAEQIGVK